MQNEITTTQQNRQLVIAEMMQRIQQNEISVHSKTFFRMRLFAFVLLIIGICITSILLCSFILFSLRMTGQPDFIGFGSKGVLLFFALFPWVLFILDVILIAALGVLMRQVSFGYRIPGIYVLGMIFAIIVISGYVVDTKTSLHSSMLLRADKNQLPFLHSAYTNVRRGPPEGYGIYRGIVMFREGDTLYVDLHKASGLGTSTTVIISIQDNPDAPQIEVGDSVFISGKITGNQILDAQLKRAHPLPPRF